MPTASDVLLILFTFVLAGYVKGVLGLGLPTISLAVLTATMGLHAAMSLLLVPSLVTNLWQAVAGGSAWTVLAQTWPFLLAATLSVGIGVQVFVRVDAPLLSALLGVLLVLYALFSLTRPRLAIPARHRVWAGPLLGTLNGVLTGMTGSFLVPGVFYLQAIGLTRDRFIQAMAMLFSASTVALALGFGSERLITAELGALSAAAVIPALVGMALGQRLRSRLPEAAFRRVFFAALMALGAYIAATQAFGWFGGADRTA